MSSSLAVPGSSSRSTGPTPPSRPRPKPRVPQGPRATRAYGFLIDRECLERWAKSYHARSHGADALSKLPPDQAARKLDSACAATVSFIPTIAYRAFPNLPRLYRNINVVEGYRAGNFIFVLRDNSSHEARHAPIEVEDLKGAKELLGLKSSARWYDVNE